MANGTGLEGKLKELEDKFSTLSSKEYEKEVQSITETFGKLPGAAELIKKFTEKMKEAAKSLKEFNVSTFKDELTSLVPSLKGFENSIVNFGATYLRLALLPKIDLAKGLPTTDVFGDLNDSATTFADTYGKFLPDKIAEQVKVFADAEQRFNKMSQGLMAAAASSGNLTEFLDELSDSANKIDPSKLEAKLATLNQMNYKVADSLGTNISKVREFGNYVQSKMPRALDENNKIISKSGDSYNYLEAAMRVSMGTMQSSVAVQDYVNKSFYRFNVSNQTALENFTAMASTADSLDLPFDNLKNYIDQNADSFLYFTDNTQALVNVMGKLAPAFRAAKLSPEAITELTTNMVKNINGMALAQRSFLSMQSGGAGGLRGGYEIELLKAQGKFDEIQKKTEQALRKQFGGKVVTLEEAARDEGAARQLAKQVQLVTSGPTKVVDTEAQAYKLFEAMRTGISGTAVQGKDALAQTMDTSTKIQETQTSILTDISNYTEYMAANTTIMARSANKDVSNVVQGLFKQGAGFLQKAIDSDLFDVSEIGSDNQQRREKSSNEAARMTVNADKSPLAASQLTLQQQRDFSKPLPSVPAKGSEESQTLALPIVKPTPIVDWTKVTRQVEAIPPSTALSQAATNMPASSSHQVTINVKSDNKDVASLVTRIINGEMTLEAQSSTIGASIEPNP